MIYLLEDFTDCDSQETLGMWQTFEEAKSYAEKYLEKYYQIGSFALLAIYERDFGPGDAKRSWTYLFHKKEWLPLNKKEKQNDR